MPYNTHQLHLCADRRDVESIQLKAFVPNFSISLKDAESGFNYYYQIFLSGLYLDKNVNSDRSGFLFEDSEMFISNDRIIKQTIEQIKIDLSDILKNIQTNKVNKIGDYVRKKSPQYRILLNDKYNSFLENVSPKATGKDLEMDLYEQYYQINKEAKKKAHELENNKLESTTDIEKFNNTFINYMNEINDMGKSKLAEYVVCRKSILNGNSYMHLTFVIIVQLSEQKEYDFLYGIFHFFSCMRAYQLLMLRQKMVIIFQNRLAIL